MSDRVKPGKGCKGEVLAGGCGGVPHNKDPPSPGQEKGARSKTTQGEGMRSSSSWNQASIGWKSPLDRRLRSRMATRPFQFTGMEERHTPKSELLRVEIRC